MKVYALIEMWESTEEFSGNDLLLITTDYNKAKEMMSKRYNEAMKEINSLPEEDENFPDNYISDWSAEATQSWEDGDYYNRFYWNIVPYTMEE